MAIQLPRIQKNDVYNASTAIPEAQATGAEAGYNLAEGNIKVLDAVGKTITTKQEADRKLQTEQNKMLTDARKMRAKSLANSYNEKIDKLTAQFSALPMGGDLTPQYESLKEQQDSLKKQLKAEAYDSQTLQFLDRELISQDAVLNKGIEVKYAQANVAAKTQTVKQSNSIEKRNFITQAALFNPADESSIKPLDTALFKIEENSVQYADSMGFLKDATGQAVSLPKEIKDDIKNQQSDAVKLSVSTLIGENDTGRAQVIFNRYGEYLTDQDKVTIGTQLKKASNEKQNFSWANDIVNRTPEDQQKALDKIGNDFGIERKERTGNIVASLRADQDRIKKDLNQRRLQEGVKLIEDNQKSSTSRWYTVDDMRNDAKMSAVYDKADYATKKKLDQLIKKPQFSDPKAFQTAVEIYDKPDGFKGMSSSEVQILTAPLDRKTTNLIAERWKEQNGLSVVKSIGSGDTTYIRNAVKNQLDGAGLLSTSSGFSSLFGGGSSAGDKNKMFFAKYEEQFIKDLSEVTGDYPSNSPQALALSKELAAKYIKKEKENKKSFFNFFGENQSEQPVKAPQQKVTPKPTLPVKPNIPAPTANGSTIPLQNMTQEQRAEYRRQFLRGQN